MDTEAELVVIERANVEDPRPGSKKPQYPPSSMQLVACRISGSGISKAACQLLDLICGLKSEKILI
jgi:hypothetical protein